MKYPEAPAYEPTPLETIHIQYIHDAHNDVLPVRVGEIPLYDLPEGTETKESLLKDLSPEQNRLLALQIEHKMAATKALTDLHEIAARRIKKGFTLSALAALAISGGLDYYCNVHNLPGPNWFPPGGSQVGIGVVGVIAGFGFFNARNDPNDHTEELQRLHTTSKQLQDMLPWVVKHSDEQTIPHNS